MASSPRTGQDDVGARRGFKEVGFGGQGQREGGFGGDEHDDEIGGLEPESVEILIALARQPFHVAFDRGQMGLERAGAGGVGRGAGIVQVVLERHLGIDDEAAAFGQVDDGVGLETAFGVGHADL